MSSALKDVELCPVCGLPPEYCEYGGKFDLCKPWLKENHLDLYPDLASLEVTDEMSAATLEAINAREALVGPKRKDPKKMKKEKILTFTLKTRQKHKHMTSVAGLELFDVDIKAATKAFGKKFSSGASAEKNAENLMEITVQGEIMQDLGHLCNELYDIPLECMYIVEGNKKKKLFP
ncbi:Translation initiation factor SUI1 family protein [Blastocystis sp. ATCC 50177/Nand II]|uniref:Translation initiation factor SUI1 family protein n=1 Tax=Blastocystis sp. subtype 1 (strain ATCC 50177 / NandII) TaxID=478820 RepID=A0A196SE51_BLAHN|nr:Translation initiation factor SUI1 family protein [Blastocystis sp. ATCC 50177/Nand II]